MPEITERGELLAARVSAAVAVGIAAYFGINPPGFVAQVVAFAFGLAASSFFPAILMGIFSKRMNKEGAIAGMVVGIGFTAGYISFFKFIRPDLNTAEHWLLGVSPEGIGTVGMVLNFVVATAVAAWTRPPPPRGARAGRGHPDPRDARRSGMMRRDDPVPTASCSTIDDRIAATGRLPVWVATVGLIAACSGGSSAPDAAPPTCLASTDYGTVALGEPIAAGVRNDSDNVAEILARGRLDDGPRPDLLVVELYADLGVFAANGGAIAPDTYTIAGAGPDDPVNYATCGACIRILTDVDEMGDPTDDGYLAMSGTITISSIDDDLAFQLQNLTFQQIDIDPADGFQSTVLLDDNQEQPRCTANLAQIDFTAPIEYAPAGSM